MKKSFPELLKELRGEKSMKDFAAYIGVSVKTYEHYEYGTRKPTVAFILQLVEKLKVSADWLFGVTENPYIDTGKSNTIASQNSIAINGHATNSTITTNPADYTLITRITILEEKVERLINLIGKET